MSSSTHIERGQWPLLLSLAPNDSANDSELAAAQAHVAVCQACAADRRDAAALLAELGRLPLPRPPDATVLRRAADALHRAIEAEQTTRLRAPWIEALAVAGAFGLVVGVTTRAPDATPGSWLPALLLLGAAALVPWLVERFGGWGLALASLAVPFAFARATEMHLAPEMGAACMVMEAVAAVLPVATLASLARARAVGFGSWAFAGAAAAGALAGQAALILSCPSHALGHLLFVHVGTVLVAGLMGAGLPKLVPALAPA